MAKKFLGTTTVPIEIQIEFTGKVAPGDPGCHTQRNGDPGWPKTGPEVDDVQIHLTTEQGKAFLALTQKHAFAFTGDVVEEIIRAVVGEGEWEEILDGVREAILVDVAGDDRRSKRGEEEL